MLASEQDRPDAARRRERWQARQKQVAPGRLVSIDETWAKTNMAPLRGWAPKGQRLTTKVPQGRWKTLTFLAALRCDSIEAPWLIDGPINGERFRLYVEKVLVPVLRPGDIVVMDNLGSHRGLEVRRAIRNAGARLRRALARSFDTVCDAIGQALNAFTPQECANYFVNSGYAQT